MIWNPFELIRIIRAPSVLAVIEKRRQLDWTMEKRRQHEWDTFLCQSSGGKLCPVHGLQAMTAEDLDRQIKAAIASLDRG